MLAVSPQPLQLLPKEEVEVVELQAPSLAPSLTELEYPTPSLVALDPSSLPYPVL